MVSKYKNCINPFLTPSLKNISNISIIISFSAGENCISMNPLALKKNILFNNWQ